MAMLISLTCPFYLSTALLLTPSLVEAGMSGMLDTQIMANHPPNRVTHDIAAHLASPVSQEKATFMLQITSVS